MPFTSPVLDDFNRNVAGANVDPPGPNWPEYTILNTPWNHDHFYVGQLSSIQPNRLGPASTSSSNVFNSGYWSPLPNLTNFEAYVTAVSWPQGGAQGYSWGLLGRIQNPGTVNARGTGVSINMATNDFTFVFCELPNNLFANIRSFSPSLGPISLALNDKVGMRLYERVSDVHFSGTVVELWTRRAADGNQWLRQGLALDTYPNRILAPGPFGMISNPNITGQRMVYDDFSVAEIVAPSSDIGYTARRSDISRVGDKSIPGGTLVFPDEPYLSDQVWTASMFEGEEEVVGGGGISIYSTST